MPKLMVVYVVDPIVVPTIHLVKGITVINKMINGTERTMLTITPSTLLIMGFGAIPSLSVITKITPKGRPIR